jgi:hypothetical protein
MLVNGWINNILKEVAVITNDINSINWEDNNIKLYMLDDRAIEECVRVLNSTNSIK